LVIPLTCKWHVRVQTRDVHKRIAVYKQGWAFLLNSNVVHKHVDRREVFDGAVNSFFDGCWIRNICLHMMNSKQHAAKRRGPSARRHIHAHCCTHSHSQDSLSLSLALSRSLTHPHPSTHPLALAFTHSAPAHAHSKRPQAIPSADAQCLSCTRPHHASCKHSASHKPSPPSHARIPRAAHLRAPKGKSRLLIGMMSTQTTL
jgi:hypothetical protein